MCKNIIKGNFWCFVNSLCYIFYMVSNVLHVYIHDYYLGINRLFLSLCSNDAFQSCVCMGYD